MYRFHKYNPGGIGHLTKPQAKFNPFDMRDTNFLRAFTERVIIKKCARRNGIIEKRSD